MLVDRRFLLGSFLAMTLGLTPVSGFAKSGNSGSGSSNSGSGSGGGDDDDYDDDDHDGARADDDQDDASGAVSRGDIKPLQKVLLVALLNIPGKVIDVRLQRRSGDFIYRISILTDAGQKRDLYINARTLSILRVR